MFSYISRSMTLKMTIAITVVMVIAFGGLGWYAVSEGQDSIVEMEKRWNNNFADFVDNSLQHYMELNDPEGLSRFLQDSSKSKGLKVLSIINADQITKYSGDPLEIGKKISNPNVREMIIESQQRREAIYGVSDGLSLTTVPLVSTEDCASCHIHQPVGKYIGTIAIGHDVGDVLARVEKVGRDGLLLFIGAIILVIAALYVLIRRMILSPLFRLVHDAKMNAAGDLNHPFSLDSNDEMRHLADSLTTMQGRLHTTIDELYGVNKSVLKAIEEMDESSDILVGLSAEQASGAAEQAAAVHEVTTSAQEVATTSAQISANVDQIRKMSEDAYDACIKGRDDVSRAVEGMGTVKDKVRSISEATVELGRKSHKIGGIVSIIDEISEQTHLLALNAAIEAAGAGEHGKRFGVVAAEVRRLAERTVEATAEIKGLIEEIQESTNETVMITERGSSIVLEGTSKVDHIGGTLEVLIEKVDMTKEASKEMAVATRQQATAGEQLVVTITDINSVAVQVSRAAEKVEKNAMGIKSIAMELKNLSDTGEES